jgi:hypothetical protein
MNKKCTALSFQKNLILKKPLTFISVHYIISLVTDELTK